MIFSAIRRFIQQFFAVQQFLTTLDFRQTSFPRWYGAVWCGVPTEEIIEQRAPLLLATRDKFAHTNKIRETNNRMEVFKKGALHLSVSCVFGFRLGNDAIWGVTSSLQAQFYYLQFTNRKQRVGEELVSLDSKIERLARLAYPKCSLDYSTSLEVRDKIACAQFIAALIMKLMLRKRIN